MADDGKTLYFRVDASPEIGAGHVTRCIALAQAWTVSENGGRSVFIGDIPSRLVARLPAAGATYRAVSAAHSDRTDLDETLAAVPQGSTIVVDGYGFDAAYLRALTESGRYVALIDDDRKLAEYPVDLILNQDVFAAGFTYPAPAETVLLLGPRYAMLRREFVAWREWDRPFSQPAGKVLLTFGGTDPKRLTSAVLAAALRSTPACTEFKAIVGPTNPMHGELSARFANDRRVEIVADADDMSALMAWADVGISAGGITSWEMCMMGLPAIVVCVTENQMRFAAEMQDHGAAIDAGLADGDAAERIAGHLHALLADTGGRRTMSRHGRELVDGLGATRVAEILRDMNRSRAAAS